MRFAEQEGGNLFGESSLANPGRADQKHGVGNSREPLPEQLSPNFFIPCNIFIIR